MSPWRARSPPLRIADTPLFPNANASGGGRGWSSAYTDTNHSLVTVSANSAGYGAASLHCHKVGLWFKFKPKLGLVLSLKLLFKSHRGCLCPGRVLVSGIAGMTLTSLVWGIMSYFLCEQGTRMAVPGYCEGRCQHCLPSEGTWELAIPGECVWEHLSLVLAAWVQ